MPNTVFMKNNSISNSLALKQRRDFLKFMGRTATLSSLSPLLANLSCTSLPTQEAPFPVVRPNLNDDLTLAEGLSYELLIKFNDAINPSEFFGSHNDYLALTLLPGKKDEGVLLVNHEYVHPVLIHERKMDRSRTREEIIREQLAVGCSLIHIKNENGSWKFVPGSKYNRRISAKTPIPFQKGYTILGSQLAIGTMTNCAGGKTPWGTVLTCEENYDIFVGEVTFENKERKFIPVDKYRWFDYFPFPPEHYGWVVEVNPFTGRAVKRNALGRFEHECATIKMTKDGRPVVYMGEDRKFGHIYKFISSQKNSLEKGTLYAADTEKGRWIPLDLKKNKNLQPHFDSQVDVLTYASYAAQLAGATPQDRPEDIEIDPATGDIFVSLTNNVDRQNFYGSLLKIVEKDNNCESLEFSATTWLSGGPSTGIACPDNMAFDKNGNLWVTSDIPDEDNNKGPYKGMGHNSLFYIPLKGKFAGQAYRIATTPRDAEFTGPMFSEDSKTLFLCVQHPGAMTIDPQKPTSTWPEKKGLPKSSVVTIQGPLLDRLMQI
jgi:uncharacterized protein